VTAYTDDVAVIHADQTDVAVVHGIVKLYEEATVASINICKSRARALGGGGGFERCNRYIGRSLGL
jgi:hypothetical protein